MRRLTFASTERAEQAGAPAQRDGARLPDFAAGDELGLITRDVATRTGALTGLLVVWNATERQPDVLCACGTVRAEDRLAVAATWSGFVGRVLNSGHTAGEPIAEHQNPLLAASSGTPVTYAIGASVRPPDRPPGALCVGLPGAPIDPGRTEWVVESYARLAALCLHDTAALGGLLTAAREDALTGCLNYGAIRAELEREIGRSLRHGRVVSCCFVDLDRFKQVNEKHGHLDGSRILAETARVLRGEVRIGDRIGRYGGDEFIIVLPDTDREAACALAERLRAKICIATAERTPARLDASIGVAEWRPGMAADELLAAADHALRSAKQSGGGRVVGAGGAAAGVGRGAAGAYAKRQRLVKHRTVPTEPIKGDPRA